MHENAQANGQHNHVVQNAHAKTKQKTPSK